MKKSKKAEQGLKLLFKKERLKPLGPKQTSAVRGGDLSSGGIVRDPKTSGGSGGL